MEELQKSENQKNYYQKIVVILYACFLGFMFFIVLYRGIRRGILGLEDEQSTEAGINWEERYPFEVAGEGDNGAGGQTEQPSAQQNSLLNRYVQKVGSIKNTLEWYCTDGFELQKQCIELTAYVNKLCGTRVIRSANTLVSIHDGYITMPAGKIDTEAYAENVIEFVEFLDAAGIPSLYVESLFKVDRTDHDPLLYDDYTNRNADELLHYLREAGVEVMDLRENVFSQELDHYSLFFKTDTHWLPSTGLWAAGEIVAHLNEEFGALIDSDLLLSDRYQGILYEDAFLGSLGRNAGLSWCGADDFTLLLPDFDTDLSYVSEGAGIDRSGSFDEALIFWEHLENIDYYEESCYASYMNGRQACAQIYNHMAENDIRILLISDSFGATVAPFLALEVSEVDFIDPRLFNGSIESYIRESEPDIVVVMMNPEVITEVSPDSNDSMYMLK